MAINTRVTLRRLVQELKEWADAHKMIAKFGYGDFLDLYVQDERAYPYFMVNCSNAPHDQLYIKYQLEIFIGFWVWDERYNQLRAESDSNQIVDDLMDTIRISDRWQSFSKIVGDFSGLKIIERGGDKVTGWGGTINLWVKRKSGICDLKILMPEYDFETQSTVESGSGFLINGDEVDHIECGEDLGINLIDTEGGVPDYTYDSLTKTLEVQAVGGSQVYNVISGGVPQGTITFDGTPKTIDVY